MVLVYVESPNGSFKKAAFEAVTYGHKTAQVLGTQCVALTLGTANDAGQLGKYGAAQVLNVANENLNNFDSQTYTGIIAAIAQQVGAQVIVLNHSSTGKSLLGRLAAKLDAGSVSAVKTVPTVDGGFKVKRNVFSGKAIAEYEVKSEVKVLSLMGNALPPAEVGEPVSVQSIDAEGPAGRIKVLERKVVDGTVPLPEAELVVSAGRGMKGPDNWGIIEELATELGATTACSRPVADLSLIHISEPTRPY